MRITRLCVRPPWPGPRPRRPCTSPIGPLARNASANGAACRAPPSRPSQTVRCGPAVPGPIIFPTRHTILTEFVRNQFLAAPELLQGLAGLLHACLELPQRRLRRHHAHLRLSQGQCPVSSICVLRGLHPYLSELPSWRALPESWRILRCQVNGWAYVVEFGGLWRGVLVGYGPAGTGRTGPQLLTVATVLSAGDADAGAVVGRAYELDAGTEHLVIAFPPKKPTDQLE